MITINIQDTKNPANGFNVCTDSFKSVNEATRGIIDFIDYGAGKPDSIGKALANIDEEFLVHVGQDSSFVEIIGYNFYTKLLTVHLNSGTYEYEGVPAATFLMFVNADSKGRFYNTYIKGLTSR